MGLLRPKSTFIDRPRHGDFNTFVYNLILFNKWMLASNAGFHWYNSSLQLFFWEHE